MSRSCNSDFVLIQNLFWPMARCSERDHIAALNTAGGSNKNNLKHADLSLKTVYNVMNSEKETGSVSNGPIPGRNHSFLTKWHCNTVCKKVARKPLRSMPQEKSIFNCQEESLQNCPR